MHPQNGNKDSAESAWNMAGSLRPRRMLPSDKHLGYCLFSCRPPKMGEHGITAFPTKMYLAIYIVFILYFYVFLFTAIFKQPVACNHNFKVVQISLRHVFAKAGESPRKMHTCVQIRYTYIHRFLANTYRVICLAFYVLM